MPRVRVWGRRGWTTRLATWMMMLTKLRVPHGLLIATILEDHHVSTGCTAQMQFGAGLGPSALPACDDHHSVRQRSRVEVSIMDSWSRRTRAMCQLQQQNRNGSANNTLATALEKLQSALQKSGIDRATTRPTAEG